MLVKENSFYVWMSIFQLNAEYKKSQQDFERRLADKDIQIASDKCHLQQLACKVDDIEDKHSEKLMELELEKSSLEGKLV